MEIMAHSAAKCQDISREISSDYVIGLKLIRVPAVFTQYAVVSLMAYKER